MKSLKPIIMLEVADQERCTVNDNDGIPGSCVTREVATPYSNVMHDVIRQKRNVKIPSHIHVYNHLKGV